MLLIPSNPPKSDESAMVAFYFLNISAGLYLTFQGPECKHSFPLEQSNDLTMANLFIFFVKNSIDDLLK